MNHKRVVWGGNLFWGMRFRTCKNFWDFADSKSSLNPKNSYKYKSHTAITSIAIRVANRLRIKCESTILVIARRIVDSPKQSTPIVILSVAKYPNKINLRVAQQIKSFCYFWLLPKVESPLLPHHCEAIHRRSNQKKNQHNGAK